MQQKRNIAEAPGLQTDNLFLGSVSFLDVQNFGEVFPVFSKLSLREKLTIEQRATEMSQVALDLLKINFLKIVNVKGQLS